MIRVIRLIAVSLLFMDLAGCMPVATLIVKVGSGYDERGMEKAEMLFEESGLSRGIPDPSSSRTINGRYADHQSMSSIFYQNKIRAFNARVYLHQPDGALSLEFYQFGQKQFDESAQKPIDDIVKRSKSVFGDGAIVVRKVGWGTL